MVQHLLRSLSFALRLSSYQSDLLIKTNHIDLRLYSVRYVIIYYLTMKKIIAFLFFVLTIYSLQVAETHEQAKPAPAQPPAANNQAKPTPAAPSAPAKPKHQPHKEPGYPSKPGNPFGKDTEGHRTCFQAPCYDPTEPCQVVVKPTPAPVPPKTSAKPSTAASTPAAPASAGAKASTHAQAAPKAAPAAVTTKPGTWLPILYVVRINGKIAKYSGYKCT